MHTVFIYCHGPATISIEPSSPRRQDCLLHEMIFTNARLIFPEEIRDKLEVVVEEGKITAIRERSSAHRTHAVIDLNGNYLAPGFIDLHVHGALGRDTMEASADAFR
ncbi:MAG TPA: hypothetical protein VL136_06080, partial [Candidatus Babeliales bacterium]|nr:hypothetical protein [Candidatus Babeliales bacterium]